MSILDERDEYLKNPYFKQHVFSDYSPFYVTITICSILGGFLLVLNIVFCWCSRHKDYWQDRHTGNRWIQPLFTVVPHKTPPLDLSELEHGIVPQPQTRHEFIPYHDPEAQPGQRSTEYMELQKRESEI